MSGATMPAKAAMFDLDGTLLLSNRSLGGYEVLPGAIETLETLQSRRVPYVVLTNGSAYPPPEQAEKLRRLGLPVTDTQMLTPSSVAADMFRRRRYLRVLVLGSPGVGYCLAEAGIEVVLPGQPGDADVQAVYVGWHPDCNMRDIEAACRAIWNGAKLFTASDVPFFATREGRSMGYSYAIIGAIRRMTRVPVTVTGKPSMSAMRFIARQLRTAVTDVAVVGDDPLVECIMARKAGACAVAVCTGVTQRSDWLALPAARRPHVVLDGVGELLDSGVLAAPA